MDIALVSFIDTLHQYRPLDERSTTICRHVIERILSWLNISHTLFIEVYMYKVMNW